MNKGMRGGFARSRFFSRIYFEEGCGTVVVVGGLRSLTWIGGVEYLILSFPV